MALEDSASRPASPEETLAFEIALGRPLASFPPGRYAFHIHAPGGHGAEALPEPDLAPVSLHTLALTAGLGEDEIAAMDEEALREAVTDKIGDVRTNDEEDGFPKLIEAPSMLELLRTLVERDYINVDFIGDPDVGDASVSDEALDAMFPYDEAPFADFRAIKDLRYRRIALALHGEMALMGLVYKYEDLFYCQGVLDRRPGWEFVCGWDAVPHRQDEGSAILYRRD